MVFCTNRVIAVAVLAAIFATMIASQSLFARTPTSPDERGLAASDSKSTTRLGIGQAGVRRMMLELEHKLESLAATLAKTEPDQAKRLGDALRESKKMLLADRMAHIAKLLNETQLKKASEQQKVLIDELKKLVEILATEEDHDEIPDLKKRIAILKGLIEGEKSNQDATEKAAGDPEAAKRIAKLEKELADKAAKLAKAMGKGSPGQAKVEEGNQSQNSAAGKLGKGDAKGAAGDQGDAIEDFEEAKDELEERLAQLRKEMQLEFLAALESRFRMMLERQRPLTQATAAYHKKHPDRTKRTRVETLPVREFVNEERELAEQARRALDIILEDGTSVIFPKIVGQLRDDLRGVAALLDKGHTGNYTQSQQKEIERTLEELIDAVKKAQESKGAEPGKPGEPGEPGAPPEPEPLLPDSAELKLLKSAQLRVNRRTERFDVVRPDSDSLDVVLRKEIRTIANRQKDVATITRKIVDNY